MVLARIFPPPFGQSLEMLPVWIGLGIMLMPSIIFAIVLPKLKVGFMATAWQLPKNTFVFSRPLLRFAGSWMLGSSIATAILACVIGGPNLPILLVLLPTTISFLYSAGQRMRRHPMSEFAMPIPLPYPFVGSMRRTRHRWPIRG